MILVTGAAGKTGQAVIRALRIRGATVRALVRHAAYSGVVETLGAHDTVVGDMGDPAVVASATRGVRAVYLICPNVHPQEVELAEIVLEAARGAGASRFVYHSVLHPQTEAMPHHWLKLRVEERVLESGLPFTILQPAAYMQNLLAGWEQLVQTGRYRVPYAVTTRLGLVDLADVAAVAAVVLTSEDHAGATYELAGAEVLTQTDIAAQLSAALERPIRAEAVPRDVWAQRARASGLSEYQVDALLRMFRYYERYGFWGNSQVLTWLLGRPPTTFANFLERTKREAPRSKVRGSTRSHRGAS